jgi:4a-hydroxytetrahydrobiopterin dehydratase
MGLMDDHLSHDARTRLSRPEASDAVTEIGWRYVLGEFRTQVLTGSLPLAADAAARAAAVAGAQGHLRMDVRADRVLLSLQTAEISWVTPLDVELARRISTVVEEFRLETTSGSGAGSESESGSGSESESGLGWQSGLGSGSGARTVQAIEVGIDAMDIGAIRPFWKAVLGYADEPGRAGPLGGLVDPLGQGPAVWFQQMDAPRPQRNRIHFDVSVPHDEAHLRIAATVAAGGTLIYDAEAPAFWVLADPEGNEACVTTWQGREG